VRNEPWETMLGDALADLMHFADTAPAADSDHPGDCCAGEDVIESGLMHYREERSEMDEH
jgi:hypothetical protein